MSFVFSFWQFEFQQVTQNCVPKSFRVIICKVSHRVVEVLYHSFFLLDYCYIMTKTPAVTHIFYFCCTFRISHPTELVLGGILWTYDQVFSHGSQRPMN